MWRIAGVEFGTQLGHQLSVSRSVKVGEVESLSLLLGHCLVMADERCSALCRWLEACSVSAVTSRDWTMVVSRPAVSEHSAMVCA